MNTSASPPAGRVLTVNGGSSSVKYALFTPGDPGGPPRRTLGGAVERVGPGGPAAAVAGLLDRLAADGSLDGLAAVGHRVVHGGPDRFDPQRVTPGLLADLRAAVPLDPAHLPAEVMLVESLAARLPGVPQVACFDTAFHRDLPTAARLLPLPRRYAERGVRRYGFHGLSYSYLLGELGRLAGPDAAAGRVVLAHLGSGASLAAVRGGKCVDTTMGLTPAGGLVMGTRTGDLDPGVLVHLLRTEDLTADALDRLVNRESGLLGVSETSGDLRDLLARQATDGRAADAVELFCYSARKGIGAMAAGLGGLDTLVFAGGVGEHSAEIRGRICDDLGFLGIDLSLAANAANAPVISAGSGGVVVRVIPTDEELEIARSVFALLASSPSPAPEPTAHG